MTGEYPTIEKDQIYLWSRPHPVDATAPDSVPQPTNYQLVCHSLRFFYLFTEAMLLLLL